MEDMVDALVQSDGQAPAQTTAQQHDAAFARLDATVDSMVPPTWRSVRELTAAEPATPIAALGDRGYGYAPGNMAYTATPIGDMSPTTGGIEREFSPENSTKPYYPPAKEYTTAQIAQMIWAFLRAKEYADGNYDRQEWSFANTDVTDDFVRKVRDALDRSGTVQQAILQVVDCYGGVAYKGEQE